MRTLLLGVTVQVLVRIQLRRIGWQEEPFDLFFMLLHPSAHLLAVVHAEVIEDQKRLTALGITNQASQEANQHLGGQGFPIQHKAQLAPVGHGRNHVGGETTAAGQVYRRLADRGVAAARMVVTAHAGFVAPLDLGVLGLGPLGDAGVLVVQPALDHFRLLLVGPLQWTLWGIAPALEVLANRAHLHEKTAALADQFPYGIPRPQRKTKLELIGQLVGHQGSNQHFLAVAQTAAFPLAYTTLAAADGSPFALALGDLSPVGNLAGMNANRFANSLVGVTLLTHAQGRSTFFALFWGLSLRASVFVAADCRVCPI